MPEMILPGTYVEVRDEGLISAGRVSTGNIGIVGTAVKGPVDKAVLLSSLTEAREVFGAATANATLMKALSLTYKNGGKTVYAVRTGQGSEYAFVEGKSAIALVLQSQRQGKEGEKQPAEKLKVIVGAAVEVGEPKEAMVEVKLVEGNITETYSIKNFEDLAEKINSDSVLVIATGLDPALKAGLPNKTAASGADFVGGASPNYAESLEQLENETINIVVLAGQDTSALSTLEAHLKQTGGNKHERIGLIGTATGADGVPEGTDVPDNGRLILTTPGLSSTATGQPENLAGSYLAAAVAGLISSLPVQTSPTNKTLVLDGLTTEFNSANLEKIIQSRMLAVEKRNGFRIVKGITTSTGAWKQITTRRIVDYAIYGVRSSCDPYIGKLNNVRVRGAMQATIEGFFTRMVDNEALVSYQLQVSATRAQEIAGEARVTMTLMPTFSIDFIQVTMSLS